MAENLSRAERRRLKREEGKLKERGTEKQTKSLYFILILILIIGLFSAVYWALSSSPKLEDDEINEVKVPIMATEHTGNTDDVEYNSNPPTSGPHYTDWHKDWKFYDSELPIGGLIHNMEHGGIVVFYQPHLSQETKDLIKEFTEDEQKVIASANTEIPAPIALAAWGVYEYFDDFDEVTMNAFYKRNRNRSPENVYP